MKRTIRQSLSPILILIAVLLTLTVQSCSESGTSSSFTSTSEANNAGSMPSPLELDDTSFLIFVNDDTIYKVDALTGQSEFLGSLDGGEVISDVDVIGNTLYVTAEGNGMGAIDLSSGETLWSLPIGEFTNGFDRPSPPVCGDGHCYVMGTTGVLLSVDASTGQVKWSTDLEPTAGDDDVGDPPRLLVTTDSIYVSGISALTYNNMYVINRDDGTIRQTLALEEKATPINAPVLTGSTLVITGNQTVQAVDSESLETLWVSDRGNTVGVTNPVVVGQTVVFTELAFVEFVGVEIEEGQHIVGLDLATGKQKWSVPGGRNDMFFTQGTDGNVVYAAKSTRCSTGSVCNGQPMAIDPQSGRILWSRKHIIQFSPLAVPGYLFFGSLLEVEDLDSRRGLASIDPVNGDVRWVNSSISSSGNTPPTLVHGGKVYRRPSAPVMQLD